MKIWKKIAGMATAVGIMAAVLAAPDLNARAAAGASVESSNIEIAAQSAYTTSITVKYAKGDARIKNIKTSSKNLFARQTQQEYRSYESTYSQYPFGYARIGLYAKKPGNYKVSFDVCDAAGKKTAKLTVKVRARYNTGYDSPIQKATFSGKQDAFYTLSKKKSGKFKVTMNKGYKLKSITMVTYDAGGKRVEKKIKNNANVTLGSYVDKYEEEYVYNSYWDESESYASYHLSTSLFATTTFQVEYQNKKTKSIGMTSFGIYRMPLN